MSAALQVDLTQQEWDSDYASLEDAWRKGYSPPPILTVSQWAAKHRILSGKSSNEDGPWRNERTPYLTEIMDRLGPYDTSEFVVFMKGSQIGGTECGNNWAGYVMHHAPGPMLFVLPNLDDVDFNSEQRLDTLIEESPALRERVTAPRERGGGNSRRRKTFPGGILKLVGSNSSKQLRSMPARWVYMDEVDEYPDRVGKQGGPIELIQVRSRTFWPRKFFATSSPTIKGKSKIESLYKQTDQRKYFVPCPLCNHKQLITWKKIKFDRDEDGNPIPASIGLTCEQCHELIGEHHKQRMLMAGEWRSTAKGRRGYVGYHVSALYSPLGWYSWLDAVTDFLAAKKKLDEHRDDSGMRVFVNTVLAETWEENTGPRVEWATIKARASGYELGAVPAAGLMLTAGIDTQDDRLECIVRAFGRREESWLIHHGVLWGDPATDAPWLELDNLLRRGWPHASGAELRIVSAAVDSRGHRTQYVYNYARNRDPLVIAIAGANTPNKPVIGRPNSQDVNFEGEKIPDGVQLWPVGSDTVKALLYSRLKFDKPGPGTIHYPVGLSDEFYKQLCGERAVTKHTRGSEHTEWVKIHRQVEALDCEVYAYAAAVRAGLQHMDWDTLEEIIRKGAEAARNTVKQSTEKKTMRKYRAGFLKDRE